MLLLWFVSLIVTLIMEAVSNTMGENHCDLSSSCMNDNLPLSVVCPKNLRYTKGTCSRFLPLDNTLSCADNQINNNYIHLKDIRIKQENYYQVQIIMSLYDGLTTQDNQSFLVKFSFEGCYEFSIPFSLFMDSKDILFPCFTIPISQKHLAFFFSVHEETDQVISVQAMNYSLNNVVDGQWLGGSMFRTTYGFDDEYFYVYLNSTQDLKCLLSYDISVYESHQNHICSINQIAVYRWSDAMTLSYRLNMSRNSLSPCKKYCIYAVFVKNQQCRTLQAIYFIDIAFFQVPPTPSDNDKLDTNVLENWCENWNFSLDIKTIKNNIIVDVTLWPEYSACFGSYNMYLYLYKFNSPDCDSEKGDEMPEKYNFKAGSNNTKITKTFKNVTIGYYCIMVVPFLNEIEKQEWTRGSSVRVTEITLSNDTELNEKVEDPEFVTKMFVVMLLCFLLCFIAFALWFSSKYIRRFKRNTIRMSPGEEDGKENVSLSVVLVDKVYLFYSHDDYSIKNHVSWLKKFLKANVQISILTLSDVLPEILEHPSRMVSNVLKCGCSGKGPSCTSKKKFIIIISEKVLCNLEDNNFIWKSLEERAFHMVLDSISTAWGKAYCHLFLVAFTENIFDDHRFKSIVSKSIIGAYYTIPNDLISLCMKLGFVSSRHMRTEDLLACLENRDIKRLGSK